MSQETYINVYVLLPVYNRRDISVGFCRQLKSQQYANIQLVVIDDGSNDGTEEAIVNEIPQVTIIKTSGNAWWAGALEHGYRWLAQNASKDDIVMIANDDVWFDEQYIKNAVSFLENRSRTLLGSVVTGRSSGHVLDRGIIWDWKTGRFEIASSDQVKNINCLSTRGLFMRAGDMFAIGGFWPKLLPHYLSDYEYTMRAHNMGFKLVTDTSVAIQTSDSSSGIQNYRVDTWSNFIKDYFSPRNYAHPIYSLTFVVLAAPSFKYKVFGIFRTMICIARDFDNMLYRNLFYKFFRATAKIIYIFIRKIKNTVKRVLRWDFVGINFHLK